MTDLITQQALYKNDALSRKSIRERGVQNSVDKTCTLDAYKHIYKSAMPVTYM